LGANRDITILVTHWRQSASHYPSVKVEGRGLEARGRIAECRLTLSDGTPLEKLRFNLLLVETSRMQDELSKLDDGVIGRFSYSPYMPAQADIPAIEPFVHGWLCLNAQLHHDVWLQVLMGGYRNCTIQLKVEPVEHQGPGWLWDVANSPSLSITSASVDFERSASKLAPAPSPPKRSKRLIWSWS